MRRIFAATWTIVMLLAGTAAAAAADYVIDLTHSHVLFMVDHLGFAKMVGLFSNFSGNFSLDPGNVTASKLAVTIKTDSLQTQFAPRDKDLKGADWFNVTEFPEMTFVGTEFAMKDEHAGTITANLTLHGTTKPVTLDVVLNKVGQNPLDKKNSAGLSARGTLAFRFRHEGILGPDRRRDRDHHRDRGQTEVLKIGWVQIPVAMKGGRAEGSTAAYDPG